MYLRDNRDPAHQHQAMCTILATCPDLAGLPDGLRERLAAVPGWRARRIAAGDVVIDEDRPSPGIVVVLRGELQAVRRDRAGGTARVYALHAGHLVGEEALLPLLARWGRPLPQWISMGVRATHDTRVVELPLHAIVRFDQELAGEPELQARFRRRLGDMVEVAVRAPHLLRRLRNATETAALSDGQLAALLEGAGIVELGAGDALACSDEVGGLIVVLEGELRLRDPERTRVGARMSPDHRAVLDARTLYGDAVLHALVPSRLLRIDEARLGGLVESSSAFRRRLVANHLPSSARVKEAALLQEHGVEIVGYSRAPALPDLLDTDDLLDRLAGSIRAQFGERTLVLHVRDGTDTAGVPADSPGTLHVWAPTSEQRATRGDGARHLVRDGDRLVPCDPMQLVWDHVPPQGVSYVLVDLVRARQRVALYWSSMISTWVELTVPGAVSGLPDHDDPSEVLGVANNRPLAQDVPVYVVRPWSDAPAPAGPLTHPLRSVRLVLEQRPEGVHVPDEGVDRLARAVTDRLVGIALGGGGALGIAHLPLLRELAHAGIPIDIVSGTSFGAVVGAWFAWKGPAGLDELQRLMEEELLTRPVVLPRDVHLLLKPLAQVRMEHLPVAFFAVATDASNLGPALPYHTDVATAVKASGALPPAFPAKIVGTSRLLDGAFVANVPAEVLVGGGASLIITSNPISAPGPLHRGASIAARALSLIGADRVRDALRGLQVIAHRAGKDSGLDGDVHYRPRSESLLEVIQFNQLDTLLARSERQVVDDGVIALAEVAWQQLSGVTAEPVVAST